MIELGEIVLAIKNSKVKKIKCMIITIALVLCLTFLTLKF